MSQLLSASRPRRPRRADRAGLFLSALLRHRGIDRAVIVRDISPIGAKIEATDLPPAGSAVEIVRANLRVVASVAWQDGDVAGLSFASRISPECWAPGLKKREQMEVDRKLEEARKSMNGIPPLEVQEKDRCGGKLLPEAVLDRRIGEELSMLARRIDGALRSLSTFAPVIARHPRDLQALEYAGQMLGHFEKVLQADNRCAAVEKLGQEDVRRRLLR